RTLRAEALMTMLPRVTWPSPPSATRLPRRTDRMVVPRYCSMTGSPSPGRPGLVCCSMTQGDVGHLVDAHDPQQAGDHGVHVAKAHEFTLSLKGGENIEE